MASCRRPSSATSNFPAIWPTAGIRPTPRISRNAWPTATWKCCTSTRCCAAISPLFPAHMRAPSSPRCCRTGSPCSSKVSTSRHRCAKAPPDRRRGSLSRWRFPRAIFPAPKALKPICAWSIAWCVKGTQTTRAFWPSVTPRLRPTATSSSGWSGATKARWSAFATICSRPIPPRRSSSFPAACPMRNFPKCSRAWTCFSTPCAMAWPTGD
ncbi:hypothetical protein D3C78_1120860 [compost metagenome]